MVEAMILEDTMLVLTREPGQRIFIDRMKRPPGLKNLWNLFSRRAPERVATIVITRLSDAQAHVGIEANPKIYTINREEVAARIQREGPRRNGPGGRERRLRGPFTMSLTSLQNLAQSLFRRYLIRFQIVSSP